MVRMIPEELPREVLSPAEKKLFRAFQSYETDEEIVVIHSFSLAKHQANIFGEIDFLVICSEGVLVLEVKGGGVSREGGLWHYTNRYGDETENTKNPFDQAVCNMGSLREYVKKTYGSNHLYAETQYASAVIMPDCEFPYRGAGIIPEVLFDRNSTITLPDIMKTSFSYWRRICEEQHHFRAKRLYPNWVREFGNDLSGDFSFAPSLSSAIDRAERKMEKLTDVQQNILRAMKANPRILVSGGAGTGKTLLAVEECTREAIKGRSVLYVCYNRNMARFVREIFRQNDIPNVRAATFHDEMMQYFPGVESSFDNDFFSEELPKLFKDYKGTIRQYDMVVLDEAQDLLTEKYLACLDRLVVKGWKYGSWTVFFDPRQNIYNEDGAMNSVITQKLEKVAVKCLLSINCRNTREIVDANQALTGLTDEDAEVDARGPAVREIPYSGIEDERAKVISLITDLKKEGMRVSDMVILSHYAEGNQKSIFHDWDPERDLPVRFTYNEDVWRGGQVNTLRGATVSSFKGLESRIVILCDVNGFTRDLKQKLNYIGISRAKSALWIFYDEKAEDERKAMKERQAR